jgi:NAD(P)-dependent dehydrogenase (short-subunit alcohol dehydrogenase family)
MAKDRFGLKGKVAVVTGSGRGIGKALAEGMAEAGAKLVVCSRTRSEAEATAAGIVARGGQAMALRCDTSRRADCQRLMDAAVKRFGRLDVMVCNAGIDIIKPAETLEESEWDAILDINLKGYFNCAQLAGRQMLRQRSGGVILMNSSIAGVIGIHGLSAYAAAKGGVNQLVRTLAVEWARKRIRVNAFGPGYIANVMRGVEHIHADPKKKRHIRTFTPMGRRGTLDELVGPVVFLASDAASYVTGAVLMIDGGYSAM